MDQDPDWAALARELQDSRRVLLGLVADLDDARLEPPLLAIVNPLRWELGHVAWFQEKWALRHLRGEAPVRTDGDSLWDSARIAHDDRWKLPHPDRAATLSYMEDVLARVLERLAARRDLTDAERYFHELALFHEDMHAEALVMTRQTLGYPAPRQLGEAAPPAAEGEGRWIEIPGGRYELGAAAGSGFVFDNEKWAHPVELARYRISRTAVTAGEFRAFVEDGGYLREKLWSKAGWAWRLATGATAPLYWRREGREWWRRRFDRFVPLEPELPMMHVSWWEAEAYCRWARVRLPSEAEWERAAAGPGPAAARPRYPWGEAAAGPSCAALGGRSRGPVAVATAPDGASPDGLLHTLGNVWEWVADDFAPYPGFVADPYAEYSQPWFGSHKVLRGGSWWTRPRLIRTTWRNFYTPDRRDPFNGFRVCALDPPHGPA